MKTKVLKPEEIGANKYKIELEKMLGREVVVIDINKEGYRGILRGYDPYHLNVILMTDTLKIVVKNVVSISRKREKD